MICAVTAEVGLQRATCSASSGRAARSGTPSTACLTVARCRRRSGRRGPSAAARRPATSRSAWPRTGFASVLDEARRGTLPGMVRTGATFADAAAEWLRYIEHDARASPRRWPRYRSLLRHAAAGLRRHGARVRHAGDDRALAQRRWTLSRRTRTRPSSWSHGIFQRARKVWGLPVNPVARRREAAASAGRRHRGLLTRGGLGARRAAAGRAGRGDLPDRRLHRPAARRAARAALARRRLRRLGHPRAGELRDGRLTTPKSGKVRAVPMAPDVAEALAKLGSASIGSSDDDLVFVGEAGGYLDGSALCAVATTRRSSAPGCVSCASTTCATPSARG